MDKREEIVNRVERMGVITIDPETFRPKGDRIAYDLKNDLWQGMVLKEKDFREKITDTDWSAYEGKHVAIHCSADAIVPTWAYMLLASALEPFAATIIFGTLDQLEEELFMAHIRRLDLEAYTNRRLVIKGCGENHIPEAVYVELCVKLQKVAKAIMYGEPCSTVPVYRKSN
jgi:hypothetical protein